MNAWTKEVAIIAAALIISIVISAAVLSFVQGALAPEENNPEYKYYIGIRDTNDCTKENDTYCINRGGCVHMYGQCQRRQCPEAFP